MLSPFISAVVVGGITELAQHGVLSKLLYVDDLVLMSETIERLRNKLRKWKEAFESKGLNVNLSTTRVMINEGILKNGLSKSEVY